MHVRTFTAGLVALAAAAVLAVPAFAHTVQLNLTVTDSSCRLALTAIDKPNTSVLFHVINNGTVTHGLMIWGVKSHMFNPNSEGDLMVDFHNPGSYHYACTTGSYLHPTLFGKGVLTIRK